jgi:hypothetical protein
MLMSDAAQTLPADELRRRLEEMAGLVVTGPDAKGVTYTLTTQSQHTLNYYSLEIGGFDSEALATLEGFQFATMRSFNVLGNPVRLARLVAGGLVPMPPTEGIPQGVILVWREGHLPTITIEDGIYSVSMSFAALPPYALLVGVETNKAAAPAPAAAPPAPHPAIN